MSNITIRKATVNDLPVLLMFEQGVIKEERPFTTVLQDGKINYYDIHSLIEANDSDVLVAVNEDDQIIGSGSVIIRDSKPYFKHQQHAYLGFMYVVPEYRGKGVNQSIVQELIQWSKSRGIDEICLHVYNGNTPAIKAYEKSGFSNNLIEMRLNVGN